MVIITMGSGDTSDFMPDFPMYIAKIAKYKANRKGNGKGNSGNYKGNKGEKTERIKVRTRCKRKVSRCREGDSAKYGDFNRSGGNCFWRK